MLIVEEDNDISAGNAFCAGWYFNLIKVPYVQFYAVVFINQKYIFSNKIFIIYAFNIPSSLIK